VTEASSGRWRRLLATPTPLVFLFSIAIALLLLSRSGTWSTVGEALQQLDPWTIVLALALYGLGLGVLCIRWHALARMAGGSVGRAAASEVFLTSVVVNYAAPIGLAVPMRTALSTRDLGLPVGAAAAITLWEALFDLGTLALIGTVWIAIGGADAARLLLANGGTWLAALGVIVLAVAVISVVLTVLVRRVRERIRGFLATAISMARRQPRWWGQAALLTLLFWGLQLIVLRILLVGFGQQSPTWEAVFGLTGWPVLIGMLSPVPGGAGVREALMVAVASATGMDTAAVLLAAVAYRMALFVMLPVLYGVTRWWIATHRSGAAVNG